MSTTLKDLIRDEIHQYDVDTAQGSSPDPEVLAQAITEIIKHYMEVELFED